MCILPFLSKNLTLKHCSIYPKSKQTRLSFPKVSLFNSFSHFQLFHLDIWGSLEHPLVMEKNISLTILDDFLGAIGHILINSLLWLLINFH